VSWQSTEWNGPLLDCFLFLSFLSSTPPTTPPTMAPVFEEVPPPPDEEPSADEDAVEATWLVMSEVAVWPFWVTLTSQLEEWVGVGDLRRNGRITSQ
jgi:hypothetical protein